MVPHVAVVVTIGIGVKFSSAYLGTSNYPSAINALVSWFIFSVAFAYADTAFVIVQLGFPWCVKVADINFYACRVLRGL